MSKQFENLCKPFKIGKVTVKNRFCMAPMGGNFMFGPKGEYNQEGIQYYVERAKGGFGLIFTGILSPDMDVDPFSSVESNSPLYAPMTFRRSAIELTDRVRSYGSNIFAQITMGLGRNYEGLYAPSELPVYGASDNKMSRALTKEQIKKKIEAVVNTAGLAKSSGFNGVEVHSIHWGYLLDQFAMSLTNKRTDEYGGSLENRLRAAREILDGIKQVCGADFPVTMRLGLKTYVKAFGKATLTGDEEAGRTLEEGVRIAQLLESYGYDALSVDTGIYDSFYYALPPMYMPKGYMTDIAGEAKKAVKIPILAGSRMNDPRIAEQAIKDGKIDAVVLARASLADPCFPKKVEMGKPEKIRPCIACNQACGYRALSLGANQSCAVNPAAAREVWYRLERASRPKKIVIVGGGVAGMEAARTATLRGHQVSVYEKSDSLGGHLISGGAHSFKTEVKELNEWYEQELMDLNVDIHTGMELTAEKIKAMKADAVILAVGSVPVMPKLPGIDSPKVASSVDALRGKKKIGEHVVVIGGGLVGCEMALEYAKEGKKVTVVEALDTILSAGDPVPVPNKQMLEDLFEYHKIELVTGHKLVEVNNKGAVVAPASGSDSSKEIEADSVVIAIGFKPQPSMARELFETGAEIYEIGDGKHVGNIQWAIWEANEIAREI
ncbi:FAD-dependent oxidoreductase [Clostridium sp. KNHs216]|uniref:oxidoreductase n=1 Tax=Clostridium sp. KNHs216 TaxID=1550235 RepID=UPI00114EC9EE|nr:FAD-dependent oxidoreductase [Clostridium sp. KNHs216]TQI67078.1 2-enoate reductase [Clostridium sp. KNHs216]